MKLIATPATILGLVASFFTLSVYADFTGYTNLTNGQAQLIHSEAVVKKGGLLSKLPFMGEKIEQKYGEKITNEISGTCSISLMKDSVIVSLDKGPIKQVYTGSTVGIIGGMNSPHHSRTVTLVGNKGERMLVGVSIETANPRINYNEFIRHPGERFCQNFIEQHPNVRSYHFSVGNEIKRKIELDEKAGVVTLSEEGICNVTNHKVAVKCSVSAASEISDFMDYTEARLKQ